MNNTLKYKLDTAGIAAFVIGVSISVIVGRLFFFGTNAKSCIGRSCIMNKNVRKAVIAGNWKMNKNQ